MKKRIVKQLRALQRIAGAVDVTGRVYLSVSGSCDEYDQALASLKADGWDVYRHYVQIGKIQVGITLD